MHKKYRRKIGVVFMCDVIKERLAQVRVAGLDGNLVAGCLTRIAANASVKGKCYRYLGNARSSAGIAGIGNHINDSVLVHMKKKVGKCDGGVTHMQHLRARARERERE